ncbi:MAG: phage holin [Oscillospiraceae bacterium]
MINWKVRLASKAFWVAIIPALLLLVQAIAAVFGYTLALDGIEARLLDLVNAVFAVLVILGIVNDPTTAGLSDSKLAMSYTKPKED